MTIVENARLVTGGVDTHADVHVAAVIDSNGAMLGVESFPTTRAGYAQLHGWLAGFGSLRRVGVEGTGAYGAGLARYLRGCGLEVIEVDRPNRQLRRGSGKSDTIDAIEAARATLSGRACGLAKSADNPPPRSWRQGLADSEFCRPRRRVPSGTLCGPDATTFEPRVVSGPGRSVISRGCPSCSPRARHDAHGEARTSSRTPSDSSPSASIQPWGVHPAAASIACGSPVRVPSVVSRDRGGGWLSRSASRARGFRRRTASGRRSAPPPGSPSLQCPRTVTCCQKARNTDGTN
jgi:hypothetical protein